MGSESSRAQHAPCPPPPQGFSQRFCGPCPPHMLGLCALDQGSTAEQRVTTTLEQRHLVNKSIKRERGEDSSDLHAALCWGRAGGTVPILWVRKLSPEREEQREHPRRTQAPGAPPTPTQGRAGALTVLGGRSSATAASDPRSAGSSRSVREGCLQENRLGEQGLGQDHPLGPRPGLPTSSPPAPQPRLTSKDAGVSIPI